MKTLAQTLASTTPVSVLLRKARKLGIRDIEAMIHLAAERGCRHYHTDYESLLNLPTREEFTDTELTILLLVGENRYEPTAIRCAAQLAHSTQVNPLDLSNLAVKEKTERVLAHIARAGEVHDPEGKVFWQAILNHLPHQPPRTEPDLPHWSRFVSMPGRQRSGIAATRWLVPNP
jgi:hypothetical protein